MDRPTSRPPRIARFGDGFEFDLDLHRLHRRGRLIRLERIPRELLRLLITRPGEVVSRQEIVDDIWGPDVFLDTDNSINGAIRKIRHALRDDAEEPRFVETVTGRGYRFVAPVSQESPAAPPQPIESIALPQSETPPPPSPADVQAVSAPPSRDAAFTDGPSRRIFAGSLIGLLLVGLPLAYTFNARNLATPAASFSHLAVSDRAEPWHPMVTDGSRVYFLERAGSGWNVAHTSVAGDPAHVFRVPFEHTRLLAVSPDRSEFLIAPFTSAGGLLPLWTWAVHGGEPRRVGEVQAMDAEWSVDGREILYSRAGEIRQVDRDGCADRLLIRVQGDPTRMEWSPDGRRLSFTVGIPGTKQQTLWEANADGSEARIRVHPVEAGGAVCCGQWTPDGEYFLYAASKGGTWNLWVVREGRWLPWRRPRGPVQLTNSASSIYGALSVSDRRIFTFVDSARYDYVKYATASGQFSSLLANMQVLDLRFSRDFESAAFQTDPDGSLWRSKADGTARVRLLEAGGRGAQPRWSPDGRAIAFESRQPGGFRAYVISASGGIPEPLLPDYPGTQSVPDWSPDGRSLVVSLNFLADEQSPLPRGIFIVDRATRQATKVPGSEGLTAPFWSPDGRHLLASVSGQQTIKRYDVSTNAWTTVATGRRLSGQSWSPDSRYLYVQDVLEPGMPVYRLEAPTFARDATFTLDALLSRGIPRAVFLGLTPDGSFILQLTRAGTMIYAVDLDLP